MSAGAQPFVSVEVLVTPEARSAALRADALHGLTSTPKSLPPVWFYDELGSQLFDRITRLPEYYLTRAERSILEVHADQIVDESGADTLVEIGSGTSEKTRLILDALGRSGRLRSVVLLDISEEVVRSAAAALAERYGVEVHAVVGDFRSELLKLPRSGRQLWAFLGSTIGNFNPVERAGLISDFQMAMDPADHLLLGTDLVKEEKRLLAAYDDAEGVTAAFNLNVLSVLDRELDARFDPATFEHRAVWNRAERWIEMRLRSLEDQTVRVEGLRLDVHFAEGEEILTEISAKFDVARLRGELSDAGFDTQMAWVDDAGDFALTLARPAG